MHRRLLLHHVVAHVRPRVDERRAESLRLRLQRLQLVVQELRELDQQHDDVPLVAVADRLEQQGPAYAVPALGASCESSVTTRMRGRCRPGRTCPRSHRKSHMPSSSSSGTSGDAMTMCGPLCTVSMPSGERDGDRGAAPLLGHLRRQTHPIPRPRPPSRRGRRLSVKVIRSFIGAASRNRQQVPVHGQRAQTALYGP